MFHSWAPEWLDRIGIAVSPAYVASLWAPSRNGQWLSSLSKSASVSRNALAALMLSPAISRTNRCPQRDSRRAAVLLDIQNVSGMHANPKRLFTISHLGAKAYRSQPSRPLNMTIEIVSALISMSFGVGGLLLAALGLYGLLAYLVTERTKDIGIRIALGARPARITGSVVAGGLALVAIGAAIGIAGSLLLLRSLGTLLFCVTPYDVPTYAIVVVLLGAIAALASYLPARRAARIEPLTALRHE
jgi:ABC-type antimicrobial peptide transport system permease subunit